MSCKCKKDKCVCEKVRRIADAQDAVDNNCCDSGCEQSIRDLVSPTGGNGADTIPFMLLCGCENTFAGLLPYFGWGVKRFNDCSIPFPSPFFRVKKFVDHKECCAILELLIPVKCEGSLFKFRNFRRTGVCLEVDLSCFTGITCFHPVNALSASEEEMYDGIEVINQFKNDSNAMSAMGNQG